MLKQHERHKRKHTSKWRSPTEPYDRNDRQAVRHEEETAQRIQRSESNERRGIWL